MKNPLRILLLPAILFTTIAWSAETTPSNGLMARGRYLVENVAGLPTLTEPQAVVFRQTGKWADGSSPRPPMPPYRLNEADAKAVVAYLTALGRH